MNASALKEGRGTRSLKKTRYLSKNHVTITRKDTVIQATRIMPEC